MRAPAEKNNSSCTEQWSELKEKDLQLCKQMRTLTVLAVWVLQYVRDIPSSSAKCHAQNGGGGAGKGLNEAMGGYRIRYLSLK